jgi:Glycosyl transferase family 2
MTLLVRDEADVVDAHIAFHLHAGVDFVIATDNGSVDGTRDVLERYRAAGRLHLIDEPAAEVRQDEWVTRMARMAATDFGADWVINSDADEFWWPRGGTLGDVLATVPRRYGVVRGCWRHFLARPDNSEFFADRMTVRLTRPAFPGDKRTIYHAHQKVAHRANPRVYVPMGNHDAEGDGLEPLRGWHPIEVLHFSFRSQAHARKKAQARWLREADDHPPLHELRLEDAYRRGTLARFYEQLVVDDKELERGLADGRFEIDTRLREALGAIRRGDSFVLPEPGATGLLPFPRPGVREDASYAAEAAVLIEIDGIVRAERRAEALEQRVSVLEEGAFRALRRLARR